ncbi:MAG: phosphate ABC transporter permease, partial [Chloroflexi bacterium]|nr:phosphate ABC transporter permease [Chloroflexota bacterium]
MRAYSQSGDTQMPQGQAFRLQIDRRHRVGRIAQLVFLCATIVGVLGLATLLYDIIDQSFGLVAVRNETAPETLAPDGVPLDELAPEQLVAILQERVSLGVLRRLESEAPLAERSRRDLYDLVVERVVRPTVVASWSLSESLLRRAEIEAATAEAHPDAVLSYRSWVNPAFLSNAQSSVPAQAGVRTALLGSLWIIG